MKHYLEAGLVTVLLAAAGCSELLHPHLDAHVVCSASGEQRHGHRNRNFAHPLSTHGQGYADTECGRRG